MHKVDKLEPFEVVRLDNILSLLFMLREKTPITFPYKSQA